MKKSLAIVFAALLIVMSFSFAACTSNTGGDTTPPPTDNTDTTATTPEPAPVDTSAGGPNANADGSTNLDMVGYYDPNFDYSANPTFKVKYLTLDTSPLYQDFDTGYAHFSSLMNIQYDGMWSCLMDNDLFVQQLQTCIDQGYNGIIMDPDVTIYPTLLDILNAHPEVKWMTGMSPARDTGDPAMPKVRPSVGFDNQAAGAEIMRELLQYAKDTWPDVSTDQIGVVFVDFSAVKALHDRQVGMYAEYMKEVGLDHNFITLDGVSGKRDADTARNLVMPIVSTNNEFTHWLAAGCFDDYTVGAAAAFDNLGLTDVACCATMGGSTLIRQWDAGQQTSWRLCYNTQGSIYAEPIIGELYADMAGYATPETIWPSWVNVNDHGKADDTYASLLLPAYWLTYDNYQKYLAWSDVYTFSNTYPDYDKTGITRDTFPAIAPVPDYYSVLQTS